jgi:Flp pilus assembly pilin Flp
MDIRLEKIRFFVRRTLARTSTSIRSSVTFLRSFWKEDEGQDLIEYTLLMTFIALAATALFLGAGKNVKGVWANANTQLGTANSNLGGS